VPELQVPVSETRYARNGDLSLAYQIVGRGPIDAVFVPGLASHVELNWEVPIGGLLERLGRFCRLIVFDKRGTGLSDRALGAGTLEERMDDVRAVMDHAHMDDAALIGVSEGGPMSILFAATHPDRTAALVLYASYSRMLVAEDDPIGVSADECAASLDWFGTRWGSGRVWLYFCQHPPDRDAAKRLGARFERYSCTPAGVVEIMRRNLEIDVRDVLGAVRTPALLLHNADDPAIPVAWSRYVAERLPNAKYVELDGDFHASFRPEDWAGVTGPIEEFLTGAPPQPEHEVERILSTLLFTDIVASTSQAAAIGDHDWRALLDRHDAIVREEVARHRGRLVKTTGDGAFATFDGPAQAVRCGLAVADRVRAIGVDVRAGVHSGECERRGDDLAGIAVHIAARIAAAAGPNEVLVSRTVRDLVVGSGLTFEDRGSVGLRGVPGEWQLAAAR
jgi:class 3 adenylate cyclase